MHLIERLQDRKLFKSDAFINGSWVSRPESFPVTNPSDAAVLASVPCMTGDDARLAIDAASQALVVWSGTPPKTRSQILRKWFDLIIAHGTDLALIISAEQGKPVTEAAGEIAYGASFVEWFAEQAKRIDGEIPAQLDGSSKRYLVLRQPVGVCAAITPWNFPLAMITRKVAPALAAGCTVVIKPSDLTPLTALALTELAVRAGFPPGVLNVITADPGASDAVGKAFCASHAVRHLSFTGSTPVGKLLMAQAAGTVKRLSMELGGNAPFIVFEDADLDAAVKGAISIKYRNAGQVCTSVNRIYVQTSIYDEFARRFVSAVQTLKVGDGRDPGVNVGPLISKSGVDKALRHIGDAVSKGGSIATGGKRTTGLFLEATVVVDATSDMLFAREETFAPVAPLFRFETESEAIEQANDTAFGLAAYFYTNDLRRVFRVSEALQYGMVGVNVAMISAENAPFGGVKESGLGREGSRHGIEDYLDIKYVCIGDL